MKIGKDLVAINVMSDFEKALRNSISLVWPEAKVQGCYFHYCQALWRYANKLGLKAEDHIDTTKVVIALLKILLSIPITAKRSYYDSLKSLILSASANRTKELCTKFFAYYEKRYAFINFADINNEERIIRTNNNCEAFHSALMKIVQVQRPRTSLLIKKLQTIELSFRTYFASKEKDPALVPPEILPGISRRDLFLPFTAFYKKIEEIVISLSPKRF